MSRLPDELGAGLVAVLAAVGVCAYRPAVRLATRWPGWSSAAYRPLLLTAAVQAIAFGVLCTSPAATT